MDNLIGIVLKICITSNIEKKKFFAFKKKEEKKKGKEIRGKRKL